MGRSHVCAVDYVYIFTLAAISVRYNFRPIKQGFTSLLPGRVPCMLRGTSPTRVAVLISVPTGRQTCLSSRVCSPSSPLIHGWTGASTEGRGGGVVLMI